MKAPFPWFGGKSRVASIVWERFGSVASYIEPFFGSGAVLLASPFQHAYRTVNDLDGYVANFWRALQAEPDEVARWADQPVNECDLHARHVWLVERRERFAERLMGDPDFFDARAAGYWVWGISTWIGSGWCSGRGPWVSVDGVLTRATNAGQGVYRQLPHLSKAEQGVNRKRPHLGTAGGGVNRRHPHPSNTGPHGEWTVEERRDALISYMRVLADRLRGVRVACGEWSRVCGPSVLRRAKPAGVFLDPPYADTASRTSDLYSTDSLTVAHDVREWAIAHGDDPHLRIAVCGYEGEHEFPASWDCIAWRAGGGYKGAGGSDVNRHRERIWFSPHCLRPDGDAGGLFGGQS